MQAWYQPGPTQLLVSPPISSPKLFPQSNTHPNTHLAAVPTHITFLRNGEPEIPSLQTITCKEQWETTEENDIGIERET